MFKHKVLDNNTLWPHDWGATQRDTSHYDNILGPAVTSCQPVAGSSCRGTFSRGPESKSPAPVSRATSALVLDALDGVRE